MTSSRKPTGNIQNGTAKNKTRKSLSSSNIKKNIKRQRSSILFSFNPKIRPNIEEGALQ